MNRHPIPLFAVGNGQERRTAGEVQHGEPMPMRGGGVILVVDDDSSILDTVIAILDQEGYDATGVTSGAAAVAFARTTAPSLILLDMHMPGMDGWACAQNLRDAGIKAPIVVMTAAETARRSAAEIGADAYLAKPFSLDDLLDVVARRWRDRRQN